MAAESLIRGCFRDNLLMRRPDLLLLPALPALPQNYALREMQPNDVPAVAAVLRRAFADETWNEARVVSVLNEQEGVKQTFLIDFQGLPIATASARLKPDQFPGSGYLHWVAVDPDHTGHRLGHVVSLAVLHAFVALGCADAVLETQDERLPAIKTYLKLGFAPVYRDETHRERWKAITRNLTA